MHVGLEAYYQFENSTNDSTTNENDISTTSGVTYTSNQIRGKLGQSLKFDPGDSATILDDMSFDQTLDPEDGITVGAFINPDAVGDGTILQKGSAYRLYLSGGRAYFEFQTSSSNTLDLGPVPSGTWTHLTATYNSSANSATGYADGTATDSLTPSGTIPDSASGITLGTGTASNYDGRLDEVRIYSRELTSTEVSSFTNPECQNRQRTIECLNNQELCDTNYPSAKKNSYHCNFGEYDDPQNTGYDNAPQNGTGVCCPKGEVANYDVVNGWFCDSTDQCGTSGPCYYDINSNESAWLNSTSDGSSNACNSQVNRLNEDLNETTRPEGSQACCYVPKNGVTDYWYKDGNVKIYG
ncbi:LamG domain-containing protein [Salinibacter grassmerensis]|uniref:LamG domain-containing protein n=1 Tax=Salinibacter grassmerensis TaxID=3040353 RepID=UPI0021E98055|nr:LamG domain-containing protein [Salinibacter grassmerensis]